MNLLAISTAKDNSVSVSKEGNLSIFHRILQEGIPYFSERHKQKGMNTRPTDEVIDYLLTNTIMVTIDDTYILGVDVIESFLSTDRVLSEEFIWRYGRGNNFSVIPSVMEYLAGKLNCNKIQVGTLACDTFRQHRALSRLYEREGFSIQSITLWR